MIRRCRSARQFLMTQSSRGENEMVVVLVDLTTGKDRILEDFICQFRVGNTRFRFDFFLVTLEQKVAIIEIDGMQHFLPALFRAPSSSTEFFAGSNSEPNTSAFASLLRSKSFVNSHISPRTEVRSFALTASLSGSHTTLQQQGHQQSQQQFLKIRKSDRYKESFIQRQKWNMLRLAHTVPFQSYRTIVRQFVNQINTNPPNKAITVKHGSCYQVQELIEKGFSESAQGQEHELFASHVLFEY